MTNSYKGSMLVSFQVLKQQYRRGTGNTRGVNLIKNLQKLLEYLWANIEYFIDVYADEIFTLIGILLSGLILLIATIGLLIMIKFLNMI